MFKRDLVSIRAGNLEQDENFILATWLRGLYYGCDWFGLIPKDVFMAAYHTVLTTLIRLPGVSIRMACLKDDPDTILGYSVTGRNDSVLHWVFVKSAWRGLGLARDLVPDTVKSVTHLSRVGRIVLRKRPSLVFNPFLI
jgi:GNAT superfamily N-acetyltransferase